MDFDIIKRYKLENNQFSKLFFFHVPKCGGLSIAHSLAATIPHLRIFGPAFQRSSEFDLNTLLIKEKINQASKFYGYELNLNSYCASEIFKKTKKIHKNYQFISGHLPFNEYKKDSKTFTFSVLREPISRQISNFLFDQEFSKEQISIDEYFIKKISPPNLMTRFFSSYEKPDVNIAINNLKKIDVVVDLNGINNLLGYIISLFKLPNIILTMVNKTKSNRSVTDKELKKIEENNQLDIELFTEAKKLFFNFEDIHKEFEEVDTYSIYSENKIFNHQNKIIFKENNLNTVKDILARA